MIGGERVGGAGEGSEKRGENKIAFRPATIHNKKGVPRSRKDSGKKRVENSRE